MYIINKLIRFVYYKIALCRLRLLSRKSICLIIDLFFFFLVYCILRDCLLFIHVSDSLLITSRRPCLSAAFTVFSILMLRGCLTVSVHCVSVRSHLHFLSIFFCTVRCLIGLCPNKLWIREYI